MNTLVLRCIKESRKCPVFTVNHLHIDLFLAGAYVISVQTGRYEYAGTDSRVYLTMKDAEGNACQTIWLHNGQEIFQVES